MKNLKKAYYNGHLSKSEFIRQSLDAHGILFDYSETIRETEIKEISITSSGVSFLIGEENIRLHSPANEARVAPIEILNFNSYESCERKLIDKLSNEARNILDIGANIGWYSIRFAKRNPKAHIYSFEPTPNSYSFLQKNIAENSLGKHVTCFNYALSDANGCLDLFITPNNGTNASLANVANRRDAYRIASLSLTLDQWRKNQNIDPDFIKCDVEGAELLVFQGGTQTLEECTPIVFTELLRKWSEPFGYHPNDLINFFKDIGYRCYAVGDEGIRRIHCVTNQTEETNYAFLHEESHVMEIRRIEETE